MWGEFKKDLAVTLTPAGDGRLEVLLDGQMLFDRKALNGAYPSRADVSKWRDTIREKIAGMVPKPATA